MNSFNRIVGSKSTPGRTLTWLFVLALAGTSGCTLFKKGSLAKATIDQGQTVYANTYSNDPDVNVAVSDKLQVFATTKAVVVTLKEDGDAVYLTAPDTTAFHATGTIIPPKSKTFSPVVAAKANSSPPKYYFSAAETGYQYQRYGQTTRGQDGKLAPSDQQVAHLRYRQWRVYVQGLAIPLKFRGAIDGAPAQGTIAARPAIPKQVETGVSVALSPGVKRSWNTYRGSKNALGLSTTSVSMAGGLLLGLGAVDVNEKSTQGRVLTAGATKNAIIPVGVHFVLGYNNINVGAAAGYDLITGPNKGAWAYKGELWTGLIVGLDIVK